MRTSRLSLVAVIASGLVTACVPDSPTTPVSRDSKGTVLGSGTWEPIPVQASKLTVHGDNSLIQRRERLSLPSRYQERLTLEGGSVLYEWLYAGGFRESDTRMIREYFDQYHKITANGFTLPEATRRFQTNGKLYYLVGSKDRINCASFLLEGSIRSGYTNAVANGYLCCNDTQMTKDALEKAMLDLASRIDFADEGKLNQVRAAAAAPAAATVGPDTRPIAVQWSGFTAPVAGVIELTQARGGGSVRMTLPNNEGSCTGTYALANASTGSWLLSCTNGLTADGTMQTHGAGRGSTGTGKDSLGRTVQFTIGGS